MMNYVLLRYLKHTVEEFMYIGHEFVEMRYVYSIKTTKTNRREVFTLVESLRYPQGALAALGTSVSGSVSGLVQVPGSGLPYYGHR